MRLKTIEIKGFKSFAEKTIINFSEPVIGVVGSNGCGKSNIVDAIRWVLGEQKTSALRSDSMTNVIFNGTKTKPAAGLAEVCLVFENNKNLLPTEYSEVAIKRVLYKDGVGEYYLNQVKCRLKDIHNLLQNTGISSDSYAIIALSMVDDLLQDKENARLALFEQAAGVAGYKGRKKETLSKLKSTDEDLARIEDLLSEIEKNMLSLEKQAARTRKYLLMKTEYKKLSLELARFQVADYKDTYKKTEIKLGEEEKQAADLAQKIAISERALSQQKNAALSHEEQLGKYQQQLNSLVGKIKGRENDHKMLTQKTWFLQDSQQKLELQIREADDKSVQYQQQVNQAIAQLDTAKNILIIYQGELKELESNLQNAKNLHENARIALESLQKEAGSAQNLRYDSEKQIAVAQSKIDQAEAQIKRIEQQAAEQQSQHRGLFLQMQQADSNVLQYQQQLENAKELQIDADLQIADTVEVIESTREALSQVSRQYDATQNEYKLLRSLVESLEGYADSVKFLNSNTDWTQQQAPLLFSDIVYCPAEYRTAIENYLEAYLSYYVVPNIAQAVQAIRLLELHKKGKANFFVVDEIPKDDDSDEIATPANAISAISVIQFDEAYRPLLRQLLRNVWLVSNEKDIPEKVGAQQVFITQDGKFTQKAFFLRGGSVAAFEGKKIGRKKNLELLQVKIDELGTQVESHKNTLQKQNALLQQLRSIDHRKNVQLLEQQVNHWSRQHLIAKSKLDNFTAQQQAQEEEVEAQQKLLRLYRRDQEARTAALQVLLLDAKQAQERAEAQRLSVQQSQDNVSRESQAFNQKNIEVLRQQNAVIAIEKEIAFGEQQIKDIAQRVASSQSSTSTTAQDVIDTEKQITEIQIELQTLYEKKTLFQQQVEAAEKLFFKQRGDINAEEENIKASNRQYQQNLQLINQLQNIFSQTKLQLSTLAERIRIEFELNINDIVNQDPDREMFEPVELDDRVQKLRVKLQNFGAVNYMAIEAYDETKTRFDFITVQRADLIDAKGLLLQTLQEIENAATELFMTAFTTVRTHFISVFRSLFEADDTCDLILSNPNAPLESKIEIVAKPKGKKPLSINQLSGGEKTLTATALLFALYLLKPAPFCIFDEVDAPLDDANIAKFNHIIRDFSKNSQFIVVTHNKKTMESVNIMYGVTMVDGISRVVPVDFRSFAPAV
jgi:chromosome segregation protein